MLKTPFVVAALIAAVASAGAPQAGAAEIKVLTPRAVATVLAQIGPKFEQATGNKIAVSVDLTANLVKRVQGGEPFDLLVATPDQIDDLVRGGTLIPGTRTDLVRSGIGVEARAGAPKPDVSTVDAFKRALLAAKSVGYLKRGQSGLYVASVLARIGIADAIKPKLVLPDTDIVSELVAKGEIELGMVVITQIMTTQGVELVGPLPADLQSYIVFAGAVGTNANAGTAARALIEFLKGPVALPVIQAQGMEPG